MSVARVVSCTRSSHVSACNIQNLGMGVGKRLGGDSILIKGGVLVLEGVLFTFLC